MIVVKHIGTDGRVRRTFTDVSSFHQHQGNNIVSVNQQAIATENIPSTLPPNVSIKGLAYEYPLALIHLAEGESVEVADEPARS